MPTCPPSLLQSADALMQRFIDVLQTNDAVPTSEIDLLLAESEHWREQAAGASSRPPDAWGVRDDEVFVKIAQDPNALEAWGPEGDGREFLPLWTSEAYAAYSGPRHLRDDPCFGDWLRAQDPTGTESEILKASVRGELERLGVGIANVTAYGQTLNILRTRGRDWHHAKQIREQLEELLVLWRDLYRRAKVPVYLVHVSVSQGEDWFVLLRDPPRRKDLITVHPDGLTVEVMEVYPHWTEVRRGHSYDVKARHVGLVR